MILNILKTSSMLVLILFLSDHLCTTPEIRQNKKSSLSQEKASHSATGGNSLHKRKGAILSTDEKTKMIKSNTKPKETPLECHWIFDFDNDVDKYFSSNIKEINILLEKYDLRRASVDTLGYTAFSKFLCDISHFYINLGKINDELSKSDQQTDNNINPKIEIFDESFTRDMFAGLAFVYTFFMKADRIMFLNNCPDYDVFYTNIKMKESYITIKLQILISHKIKDLFEEAKQIKKKCNHMKYLTILDHNIEVLAANIEKLTKIQSQTPGKDIVKEFREKCLDHILDDTLKYAKREVAPAKCHFINNEWLYVFDSNFDKYFSAEFPDILISYYKSPYNPRMLDEADYIVETIEKFKSQIILIEKRLDLIFTSRIMNETNPCAFLILEEFRKMEIFDFLNKLTINLAFGFNLLIMANQKIGKNGLKLISNNILYIKRNNYNCWRTNNFSRGFLPKIETLLRKALKVSKVCSFRDLSLKLKKNISAVHAIIEKKIVESAI